MDAPNAVPPTAAQLHFFSSTVAYAPYILWYIPTLHVWAVLLLFEQTDDVVAVQDISGAIQGSWTWKALEKRCQVTLVHSLQRSTWQARLPILQGEEAHSAHTLQAVHSPVTRQAARRAGQPHQATRPTGALAAADQDLGQSAALSPNRLSSTLRDRWGWSASPLQAQIYYLCSS